MPFGKDMNSLIPLTSDGLNSTTVGIPVRTIHFAEWKSSAAWSSDPSLCWLSKQVKLKCMLNGPTRKEHSKNKKLNKCLTRGRSSCDPSQRYPLTKNFSAYLHVCLCSPFSGASISSLSPSLSLWSQLSVLWLYTLCICSFLFFLLYCLCLFSDADPSPNLFYTCILCLPLTPLSGRLTLATVLWLTLYICL